MNSKRSPTRRLIDVVITKTVDVAVSKLQPSVAVYMNC